MPCHSYCPITIYDVQIQVLNSVSHFVEQNWLKTIKHLTVCWPSPSPSQSPKCVQTPMLYKLFKRQRFVWSLSVVDSSQIQLQDDPKMKFFDCE